MNGIMISNKFRIYGPGFSVTTHRFAINGTGFSSSVLMQQIEDYIRLSRQGELDLKETKKQKGA